MVAAWAGKHVCGRCHGIHQQVRSHDASSWSGKRLTPHHECDPTILVVEAWGDLWMDQWFLDSGGKLVRRGSQWLYIDQVQRAVDGNQVTFDCSDEAR